MLLLLTSLSWSVPLAYDEAMAIALEANPGLGQANADLEAAEARVLGSKGIYDPTLNLSAGRNWELSQGFTQIPVGTQVFLVPFDTSDVRWNWSAGVSQTLSTGTSLSADWTNFSGNTLTKYQIDGFDPVEQTNASGSTRLNTSVTQQLLEGHQRAYNMQAERAAISARDQTQAGLLQQRQELLKNVALAYWELFYAQQALQTADNAVSVAQEEVRIVQAQLDVGNVAPVDLTRVQAALAQSQLTLIQAGNSALAASDALAVFLDFPVGGPLEPSTPPGGVPVDVSMNLEQTVADALDGNPGLVAQRVAVENARADVAVGRHALLPSLSVTASAGLSGFDPQDGYKSAVDAFTTLDFPTVYVGGNFSAPLGNRSAKADLDAREAALTRAQLGLQASEQATAQAVAVSVRSIETSRRIRDLAQLNLRLAEETLSAEKARQEAGRAIQKDLLEAQRSRDAAEVELSRSMVDYRKALVELMALQGRL